MADIAHELRTPLAVVQGRLEGMLDGIYPRDETQIAAALQETRMLARLVEDLRTLAHTESGTLGAAEGINGHRRAGQRCRLLVCHGCRRPQVDLDVAVAPDLPLIEVDPLRVREVLVNLISNALRHTPEGGRVTVSASPWEGRSVNRAGYGIGHPRAGPAEDLRCFYKGRSSRGSGLGLTIARNLVVAHGGDIRAEASEGKGTIISVLLPLHPRQS